ncbi:MAG TPA: type II toxin-antitoxin system CcdA family antitoxin [Allosphingosinicella sp.]|nr:type II toxin-antitoxin system CcdA family antitoxin [Allosphingosinicella sp.]
MAATAFQPNSGSLLNRLLEEAQRLGVHVSGKSENEIRQAVREAWLEENREAIESWNAWTEKNGLPLERYRAF